MSVEFEKFLNYSTIHGLKYLSKRRHWIERFFWLLTLLTSLFLSLILIAKLIIKIKIDPIIVLIQDNQVHVSEIDFPAITACSGLMQLLPDSFYYRRHANEEIEMDYDENWKNSIDEKLLDEIKYTEILQKIENNEINVKNLGTKILKRLQVIDLMSQRGTFAFINFSIPTIDFLDVINEFDKTLLFNDLVHFSWRFSMYTGISEILTEHGLCTTFNIALANDLLITNLTSQDFQYEHNVPYCLNNFTEVIPRRALKSNQDVNLECFSESQMREAVVWDFEGNSMYWHDPYELPTKFSQTRMLSFNKITNIWIEPQIMAIDESMENDDLEERNCYLDDEFKLQFFKVYTKANCESECLSNFMIRKCNCVEFYMIRNITTRICSASEKRCFDRARNLFDRQIHKCKCLQPCYYIKYNYEAERKRAGSNQTGFEKFIKFSEMNMKYRHDFVTRFVRKKQFNEVDFLSFVGGLLGLFAGFSALSAVELFYWFIMKVFMKDCNQRSTIVQPFNEVKKSNILNDFITNSSIHGLSYLKNTNIAEKLFWMFFITLSITLCGFMMKSIEKKSWTTAIDDNINYNEKVSFPAVTFLPNRYINEIFAEQYEVKGYKELGFQRMLIKNPIQRGKFSRKLSKLSQCLLHTNFTFEKLGIHIKGIDRMRIESQLEYYEQQFATWNNNFQVVFSEIRTYFGMGFSFNLIDSRKLFNYKLINDEFKYKTNISMIQQKSMPKVIAKNYPLMVDAKSHTKFKLKIKKQYINHPYLKVCRENMIKIHSPYFLPTFMEYGEFAELKDSTNIVITLKITKTDKSLRFLSPIDRDCYFAGERKLKNFKIYTQKYCEMECVMDYMVNFCKCQMTNFVYGKERKFDFCFGQKRYCVLHEEQRLFDKHGIILEHNCTCLPECNSVNYQTTFYPAESFDDNETTITVQLNTDDLILYRKYQALTFSDAVSYVGGLLGLFAGISMLSIFEIFYFFILRTLNDFLDNLKIGKFI